MTTLTIPAEHLSVLSVTLPPTPAHRLQAALAGALEEALLDDPVDLHFALAPHAKAAMQAGRAFEVIVCNKAWLRGLVHQRVQQGQATLRIVPETPIGQTDDWDLAQFDFAPRAAWRSQLLERGKSLWHGRDWGSARIALLLLIVIQLVGINVWAWREHTALADKRADIDRILLQTFPNTPLVVDAPAQMRRATQGLKAKSGVLGDQDLESQLAKLGKPATHIDYASGHLKVSP
jgi:type II secretory pathway component PulL